MSAAAGKVSTMSPRELGLMMRMEEMSGFKIGFIPGADEGFGGENIKGNSTGSLDSAGLRSG
jgi:hypothetical protein